MGGKQRSRRLGSVFALSAAVVVAGCLKPLGPAESENLSLPNNLSQPPRGIVPVPPPPIVMRREGERVMPEENP